MVAPAPAPPCGALREIALLFLRLGATAFGGPAAHIALLEDEVVRRRGWLTRERFLDLLGATNLIPGPNSTEMAIHLGYLRGGPLGLVLAGVCFIVPASLLSAALAWAYVRFGGVPRVEGVLYGIKPAIIVIVVQAVVSLSRAALRTRWLVVIAVASAAAALLGLNELLVLGVAGTAACAPRLGRGGRGVLLAVPAAAAAAAPAAVGLWPLFLAFAKIGSVLFGSGYVLLAFLRADLVAQRHWLTEAQLLDAVAVGQFTPGPVSSTATFIGYLLRGPAGAAVATLGMFAPAFVFVALSGPLVPRIRRSPAAGAFLDGVNAASLALMAVVAAQLGRAAIVDWVTVAIAAASAVAVLRLRVSSVWLVLGGGVAGALLR
ncbi:MAG TPA: chromate efflux transporter [Myxococcales bacterium]